MFRKVIKTVLLTCILIVALGKTAYAADKTQNGITTEVNYSNTENGIDAVIIVTNNNNYAISNISVNSILPDGIEASDESKLKNSYTSLEANESKKIVFSVIKSSNVKLEDGSVGEVKKEDANKETDKNKDEHKKDEEKKTDKDSNQNALGISTINDEKVPTVSNLTNENNNDKNKTVLTTSHNKAPKTGDSISFAVFMVCLLVLSGTMILLTLRYKKRLFKVMSFFIVFAMIFPVISSLSQEVSLAAQTEVEKRNYQVQMSVYFGDDEYIINTDIEYDYTSQDDGTIYTRGEWVNMLAGVLELDIEGLDEESYNYFYGDTTDEDYGLIAEYLHSKGYLPNPDSEGYADAEQDIPLFEADKILTRKYAVYSLVKALGYSGTYEPSCEDKNELDYPSETEIALRMGFIELKNGRFEQNDNINKDDINNIISAIRALDNSLIVSEDEEKEDMDYKSDVIVYELADISDYIISDSGDGKYLVSLPLKDNTKGIEPGKVFILNPNDDNISSQAFKAETVDIAGDKVNITCVKPALSEVFNRISIAKTVTPDVINFVPEDGVVCEIADSESNEDKEIYPIGGHVSVPGKINLSINKEIKNGVDLKGAVSLAIPDITAIIDIGWDHGLAVNEVTFSISNEIDFDLGIETNDNISNFVSGKFKMGQISVPVCPGVTADVVPYVYYEANGYITVEYEVRTTFGIQVKHNAFRNINSLRGNFQSINVGADASAGAEIDTNLSLIGLEPVLGLAAKAGVGIDAASENHVTEGLYCVDAGVFFVLKTGINDDTLVGELLKNLGIGLEYEIYGKDNSPVSKHFHIENFHIVDECTYGNGKFSFYVTNETNTPIKGARVIVIDSNGNSVRTIFTKENGTCLASNLKTGYYTIKVSATGYKAYTSSNERIKKLETTQIDTLLMIDRETIGRINTVSGTVINAVNGQNINSQYSVYNGYNNKSGTPVTEGLALSGRYSLELPVGNYTIVFSAEGYVSNHVNVAIASNRPTTKDVTLVPVSGGSSTTDIDNISSDEQLRIVLTWGVTPYDLDSHLFESGADSFHVYFSNKDHYDSNGTKDVNLDLDDTNSYGPETVTIYNIKDDGLYSYAVHDYTNKSDSSSTAMSMSGACVKVYSGDVLVATYNIPVGHVGTVWNVFNYNAATGNISSVNTFSNSSTSTFSPNL